jgi:hypothetical protein
MLKQPGLFVGRRVRFVHSCGWLALSLFAACSAPAKAPSRGTSDSVSAGAPAEPPATGEVIAEMATCAPDNPFCASNPVITGSGAAGSGGPLIGTTKNCGSAPIDLRPTGVNIMIAVDGAASMARHWQDIATAVKSLRANNPTASFGMHKFWASAVDPVTEDGMMARNTTNNACNEYFNEILELGDHTADALVSFLGEGPEGGVIFDAYQTGPVLTPLNTTYLTAASALADPSKTNYLLVFTSANENCFGAAFGSSMDKQGAFQKLAIELSKRNIRVIPVGVDAPTDAPSMDPFGFGPGLTGTNVESIRTDYTVLNTMLEYGGANHIKEVPRIDTPEKLEELISVVGQAVNNCRFEIPATLDSSMSVNAFEINFTINATSVPRDRAELNGWNFVHGSTSQVEFFGQSCEALQSGLAIEAGKSCSSDVCGTAAVSVSTKPRQVLLLLDSSASRIECSDGSLDCLSLPGSSATRPPSYWEVVQHAVSDVLIAPVNNEVGFGMQFFPNKNASEFSCEVTQMPEIPAAPGTQIEIMKQMLEKVPFGLSPVVGVLESVAAAPGNLADPNVVGAVVLLSDGGDNCSGDMQPEIVTRLGTAAKSLHDKGVRTFAIRYGSMDGETAEAAEQLTVLANEGGTALAGASVAYIDAKSPEELNDALSGISDQLASCVFTLGNVADGVDRNRTNLFLDGEQIGFDAMGTKQDGWSWVDQAQTTIELFGGACNLFKTSLNTNIIVEFGCEQVITAPD